MTAYRDKAGVGLNPPSEPPTRSGWVSLGLWVPLLTSLLVIWWLTS